ncbi:MAG: hypothetical protein QW735_04395 [archaeon]
MAGKRVLENGLKPYTVVAVLESPLWIKYTVNCKLHKKLHLTEDGVVHDLTVNYEYRRING